MNWRYIMLHHSFTTDGQTVSWQAIRRYHINEKKWNDIGYHFGIELVEKTYEVLVGRPLTLPGAHCFQADMNNLAIGICCVGNYDIAQPPGEMINILSHRIIIPLLDIFDIPINNIVFHRDYAPYKTCPGIMFSKLDLIKTIKRLRGEA